MWLFLAFLLRSHSESLTRHTPLRQKDILASGLHPWSLWPLLSPFFTSLILSYFFLKHSGSVYSLRKSISMQGRMLSGTELFALEFDIFNCLTSRPSSLHYSFFSLTCCQKSFHGNPLQYSCLENFVDRGAWWATVHGIAKGQTQLKFLSTHRHASWNHPYLHFADEASDSQRCYESKVS